MPYDVNNPPDKVKHLPAKKQRQFVHVFNSCMESRGDEGVCHQMAWGVVKKGGVMSNQRITETAFNIAFGGQEHMTPDEVGLVCPKCARSMRDKNIRWAKTDVVREALFKSDKRTAKAVQAGGTLFPISSPQRDYQSYVEKTLPRVLSRSGLTGTFVKGSVKWAGKYNTMVGGEVAHYFKFEMRTNGNEVIDCDGKVSARFTGKELALRLMIYN